MKYKLKPCMHSPTIINVMGKFYRFVHDQFRDYPDEIVKTYGDMLIPEHETKTKKQAVIDSEEIE